MAEERLTINHEGSIVYRLKRPYDNGATHLVFSPLEFMERLASLVPRPKINLVRYHGLFAPHAKYRKLITPAPPESQERSQNPATNADKPPMNKYRISWARLLKRVFNLDLEKCSLCGANTKIIAAILDRKVIGLILDHIGIPSQPPRLAPARGPPLLQQMDPFPADLPVFS